MRPAPELETRKSKLETRNSKMETRNWKLDTGICFRGSSRAAVPARGRVSIFEFRCSSFESKPGQLVQAVKRGGLVAFGQGRIIEDRVDEVFDRAFQDEDRLPDMEKLRRAVANDVNAQQLFGLAVEDELQPAGGVPHDLPARDLAIVSDADFVGHVLFGELLLGFSDERDLGNGIDAVRVTRGVRVDGQSDGLGGGYPALLQGDRCLARAPHHISH